MTAWLFGVLLVVLYVLAACGTSSRTIGTGGSTSSCPTATPASGAACSPAGLQCGYGACGQVSATCSGGTWQIATSNIACDLDAGAGDATDASDGSGLPCSPACGSGQVCEYPQPPGICPQLDAGICPEGCPGCPPGPPPVPSCKPAPISCNPPACSCLIQTACGGCGGTCEVKDGQVVLACYGC